MQGTCGLKISYTYTDFNSLQLYFFIYKFQLIIWGHDYYYLKNIVSGKRFLYEKDVI